jgi:hypothetical protein
MDWGSGGCKAMLTALVVAAVLMTVRMIAMDQGAECASRTAMGSVAASGLLAVFSVVILYSAVSVALAVALILSAVTLLYF